MNPYHIVSMVTMVAPLHQVDVRSTLAIAVLVTQPPNHTSLDTTCYLLMRLLPYCTRQNTRLTSKTFSRKSKREIIVLYFGEK